MIETTPVTLTIAGSDNCAGAGAQADLKTFSAHGCYGLTAITCVVAEVPGCVEAIHPVPLAVVRSQIALLFDTWKIDAAKTGMLFSREVIEMVADIFEEHGDAAPKLVVDPVMVASSGDALLQPDAVAAYRERLFPIAALVTPNADEAAHLLGGPITSHEALEAAGKEFANRWQTPFLMKGGHLGGNEALDYLVMPDGTSIRLAAPFMEGVSPHGTGCTYAAAITAGLAVGKDLETAVREAKHYITAAIREHHIWSNVIALRHFNSAASAQQNSAPA